MNYYEYPDPYSAGTTKIYEQKIKDVKEEFKKEELKIEEIPNNLNRNRM